MHVRHPDAYSAGDRTVAPEGHDADLLNSVRAHVAGLLGEEDPEFVQDLVATFCESANDLLASARAAQQASDLDSASRTAHQLKGSASNVGLTDLEAAWKRVEEGARSGDAAALGVPLSAAIGQTERAARQLAASVA